MWMQLEAKFRIPQWPQKLILSIPRDTGPGGSRRAPLRSAGLRSAGRRAWPARQLPPSSRAPGSQSRSRARSRAKCRPAPRLRRLFLDAMHLLPRATRRPGLLPAHLVEAQVGDHRGPRPHRSETTQVPAGDRGSAVPGAGAPNLACCRVDLASYSPSCHLCFPCQLPGFPLAMGQGREGRTGWG